jgi:hypothetical protein
MSLDVALPVIPHMYANRLPAEGLPDILFDLVKNVRHGLFSDLRRPEPTMAYREKFDRPSARAHSIV